MHQITPIDISTGTYQKTTKWMNGVHQFIELKYGFEPSVDSIVTNYESNLIFFRRYRHYLYGMTGTICESLGKSENAPSIFERFLTENY
jgi:preprotein translocase subunit SecA